MPDGTEVLPDPESRRIRSATPISEFVVGLAAELDLGDGAAAVRTRRALRRLVEWTTAEGIPLERELIFDPDTIERFVEFGLRNDRSAATYRATLRAVGRRVTKRAGFEPPPYRFRRRQLAPPYTAAELQVLFADAAVQPTAARRRGAQALLALGLGAGLDGRWATRVAARDVERREEVVLVTVGEPSARSVPARAEFEDEVIELAASARGEFLIGGHSLSKNRAGQLVASLVVPTGHPSLSAARLRSTWLATHLEAGTRLPELCRAAGLQGTAMFADLLPFVRLLDDRESALMLRGARS